MEGDYMRIGICDDDEQDLELIHTICQETYDQLGMEYEILIFNKAEDILTYKEELQLLILDIEMPGLSGLELKEMLQDEEKESIIVFVTNHDELVLSAFGIRVFGFVIKKNISMQLPRILNDVLALLSPEILLEGRISSRKVRYIKAARIYTEVYLENGKRELTRKSIQEYEQMLKDYGFMRIHKSYLLNFAWVDKITDDKVYVGEKTLPIATRLRKEVKDKYREFCWKKARYC